MEIFEPDFKISLPRLQSFGITILDTIYSEKAHIANRCEMLKIIRGNITLHIEDEKFEGTAGDIMFVPKAVKHRDEFDIEQGLEILYCNFTWNDSDLFFSYVDNCKIKELTSSAKSSVETMFDLLRTDKGRGRDIDRMLSEAKLLAIFLTILRDIAASEIDDDDNSDTQTSRRKKILDEARFYIQHNYNRPISLDELASYLKISAYYLSHIFSEEGEFSYSTYLTNVRMEKARELLLNTRLNISEVAFMVGFESANYFTKVFKKASGMSPNQYVTENQKAKNTSRKN